MWYYVTGLEQSASDWITTEIEVRIRESHGDDDFVNQAGVIRNISVAYCCSVTVVYYFSNVKFVYVTGLGSKG